MKDTQEMRKIKEWVCRAEYNIAYWEIEGDTVSTDTARLFRFFFNGSLSEERINENKVIIKESGIHG